MIVSEPESVPSDASASSPPDPTVSEASDSDPSAFSAPVPSEVSEAAVTMDQDTSAAPSQSQGNKNLLKKGCDLSAESAASLGFVEFYFITAQCLDSGHKFTVLVHSRCFHGIIFR